MNEFMNEAIKEAKLGINSNHGGPFGAVIVMNGKIIGRGHNQVLINHDPTCHGEVMAIHDACNNLGSHDLKGAVIYTTGEPCPMCLGAIMWANIDKVYYGCNISDNEKIGFRDKAFDELMNNRSNLTNYLEELDRESCLDLFNQYSNMEHDNY